MDWKLIGAIFASYMVGVFVSYNHFVWHSRLLGFAMGFSLLIVYLVINHKD